MNRHWIQTLDFAGQLPIDRLIERGYGDPADFVDVSADDLMADVAGLNRPPALRLLRAAAAARGDSPASAPVAPAAAPTKVVLMHEDATARVARLLSALRDPGQRVAAAAQLRQEGIERVVLAADDSVDEAKTAAYLAEGSPACEWYDEARVVPVGRLSAPSRHHPRTGQPLSGADVVPWRNLGRDALVVAAAVYLEGLDAGEGERAVFADVSRWATAGAAADTPMATAGAARVARDPGLRRRAEARIDGDHARPGPEPAPGPARPKSPLRNGDGPGSRQSDHAAMLRTLFEAGELRRLAPEGIRGHLPESTASLIELSVALAAQLDRHGLTGDARWWARLRSERPRWAGDIAAMAGRYGVDSF